MKHIFSFFINMLILCTTIFGQYIPAIQNQEKTPFYLGVTFCGDTTKEAKLLIDRVRTYSNLFILQSGPISKNETAVNEICDYAVAARLNIIVYFGWFDSDCPWQVPWLDFAKRRWGDRFLGIYYYDEPGGVYLDYNWSQLFNKMKQQNSTTYQTVAPVLESYLNGTLPRDYDEAANRFISSIQNNPGLNELKSRSITTFTSDYALYWFDYIGGYDVVLAEFGWNNSIVQEIALVRGAAQVQNKSWGAIITWKYNEPPYLDSGDIVYEQMRVAYEAGAEYVVIFNYPQIKDNPYGAMLDEHFEAIERLWNEAKTPKPLQESVTAENILVLPRNYGWGMRRPDDRIWYWGPDEETLQIWELTRKLLSQYDLELDIIYEDKEFPITNQYTQVF
ncbi:MAG: hypothetical protein CW691_06310 [Candidatus Bathyarchaeum sp.]|nr:MAG: hypothetical protein CW691_06310 [Candidatus Bathyarchaeum sp.]